MSSSPHSAETLAFGTPTTNVPAHGVTIASGVIDSTHPYYLHPSDYPGMNFVSSSFDGKDMEVGKGQLSLPCLQRTSWDLLMVLLSSQKLILQSSKPEQDSANDLWSDLEDRFGQANGAKFFQLQKELSLVVHGNSSVSTYFTKMKSPWDELDALNTFSVCVCECECGKKVKSLKAHQDERLLQFLMGLNDIFIGREIHATPAYPGESASFIATNQSGHFRKLNENRMQKTSFEFKKNAGICSYCKKPGHSIDKCYRIHGFPADFKFTRQKIFQIGQNSAGTSDAAAKVICAGMPNFSEDIACLNQISSDSWILDSGATMSFNKEFFTNLKTLPKPLMVKLPNSYRIKVTYSGTVPLLPNLFLQNVLYIPSFKYNLLSVHKLCKQLKQYVLFTPFSCFLLQGPSMKSPLEIGKDK
nr:PREDICTED: uncharacterized protein LOC107760444 [Nicotiana tabacum]